MKIGYLADHIGTIPILARWSFDEWAYLHPDRTISDVEQLLLERSNKSTIPLCLVALENNSVIGMVALKEHDLESRPDLSPWLAGLYVDKKHRGKGIGKALVLAIEEKAAKLGVERLYLYTPGQEQFYSQLKWTVAEDTQWNGHSITIMEKMLVI